MLFDVFEQDALMPTKVDLADKLEALNACFETRVEPSEGMYGRSWVDKGLGAVEATDKTDAGHVFRDYLQDGRLYLRRVHLGNREIVTKYFDDLGTNYLDIITKTLDDGTKIVGSRLEPNATIVKGDYTAKTDAFGRSVLNRMEDVQLREPGAARQALSKNLYDDSYALQEDGTYLYQRGHLIPDSFGGPATKDNIVPQLSDVNQKQFAEVERIARQLKEEGHKVDYEVKTNYVGTDTGKAPSSFEIRIFSDGEEYALPSELRKIYNTEEASRAHKVVTTAGEKLAVGHELGLESGLLAAAITLPLSTADNVGAYLDGRITAEEMVVGIVGDTAAAGALGYSTTFITVNVSQVMSGSSNVLISRIGGSCAPAAFVSFAVASYEDVSCFAKGEIGAGELAFNLGNSAAGVAGGTAAGFYAGAALGSVAGPGGTLAGGVLGGVVGCALASEAYSSAVEMGAEGIEVLSGQVDRFAGLTMELVSETAPEKLGEVRQALNEFFAENRLPFEV